MQIFNLISGSYGTGKMPEEKLNIVLAGFYSEWSLAKFYPAVFEDEKVGGRINLHGVAGRQQATDALVRLMEAGEERFDLMKQAYSTGSDWRKEQTKREILSILALQEMLEKGSVKYLTISPENTLPVQAYNESVGAVAVITPNPTHIDFIEDSIEHDKHVTVEKSLVPLYDGRGNISRIDLDRLVLANDKLRRKGLVGKDSEHYSHKPASLQFFGLIERLHEDYGLIKQVDAYVLETDSPTKPRTKNTLSMQNRTGLLTDTGVHPLSVIANIGGVVGEVFEARYDIFQGYDVETYAKVDFSIKGKYFTQDASGSIEVGKFMRLPMEEQEKGRKYIDFVFTRKDVDTVVRVSLNSPNILINGTPVEIGNEFSKNEYVNILLDFHNAIKQGTKPISSFDTSIPILDAIARTYERFPVSRNIQSVYLV